MFYLSMLEDDSDKKLFSYLYKNYKKSLFLAAMHYCPITEDAEDLMQQVLIKIVLYIDQEHKLPKEGLYAWLMEIMKNTYLDNVKKKSAQMKTVDIEEAYDVSDDDFSEQILDDYSFEEAIAKLPEKDKQILRMKFVLCLSSAKIADALDMTPAAVRKRTERAIAKLKQYYREEEYYG